MDKKHSFFSLFSETNGSTLNGLPCIRKFYKKVLDLYISNSYIVKQKRKDCIGAELEKSVDTHLKRRQIKV